ncbi:MULTISPECIES: hypothetical protein [unclassified Streptomyces]|uniref:hypothetical protein n=1 Tax=unclassified Streptomyces TaxID=2593676 RepID=UPI002E17B1C5|nr:MULTISPECIES: hypothetical protein [unclassified Streptomyces]
MDISDGGQSLDPQWIDIGNNVSGVAYGCRDASPVAAGVTTAATVTVAGVTTATTTADHPSRGALPMLGEGTPSASFECLLPHRHPRLAEIYVPLDSDRRDLGPHIGVVQEFNARRVLDLACSDGCATPALGVRSDPAPAAIGDWHDVRTGMLIYAAVRCR